MWLPTYQHPGIKGRKEHLQSTIGIRSPSLYYSSRTSLLLSIFQQIALRSLPTCSLSSALLILSSSSSSLLQPSLVCKVCQLSMVSTPLVATIYSKLLFSSLKYSWRRRLTDNLVLPQVRLLRSDDGVKWCVRIYIYEATSCLIPTMLSIIFPVSCLHFRLLPFLPLQFWI